MRRITVIALCVTAAALPVAATPLASSASTAFTPSGCCANVRH